MSAGRTAFPNAGENAAESPAPAMAARPVAMKSLLVVLGWVMGWDGQVWLSLVRYCQGWSGIGGVWSGVVKGGLVWLSCVNSPKILKRARARKFTHFLIKWE